MCVTNMLCSCGVTFTVQPMVSKENNLGRGVFERLCHSYVIGMYTENPALLG